MKRIVFISCIRNHAWGGADALWTCAAEAAIAGGARVLLVISELLLEHPRIRGLVARGAELHIRPRSDRPIPISRRAWLRATRAVGRRDPLVARLAAFAPDRVIISGGGTYDPLLEMPLCAWLGSTGTPYRLIANYQDEHPSLPEPDRAKIRDILAGAERLFFVSARNLAATRRHLVHPLPNAHCIHGVMVHNAAPAAPSPWPKEGVCGIASVARLEPVKGLDLLLHAIARGLGAERGWHINIYGRGQQSGYLAATVKSLGLEERVTVHGFVESFTDIWRRNQLLVSASLNEGIPMTIPEAMLHGRGVLATNVGAAEEWIEDGRTGFLCPAPRIELLAESLQTAWARRTEWRHMGETAAQTARARYQPCDYLRIISDAG